MNEWVNFKYKKLLFALICDNFFAVLGLNIVDITFVMDYRGRRKTGEAYVQFEEPEMANQALLKHREEIGNRWVR